jgi:hypothetical protein
VNEIRKTMKDMKEEFNKDKNYEKIKLKSWNEKLSNPSKKLS